MPAILKFPPAVLSDFFPRRFFGNQPDGKSRNRERRGVNQKERLCSPKHTLPSRRAPSRAPSAKTLDENISAVPARSPSLPSDSASSHFSRLQKTRRTAKQNRGSVSQPEIFRARHQQKHQRNSDANQIRPIITCRRENRSTKVPAIAKTTRTAKGGRRIKFLPPSAKRRNDTHQPKRGDKIKPIAEFGNRLSPKQIAEIAVAF
jgi:hypothetical protein